MNDLRGTQHTPESHGTEKYAAMIVVALLLATTGYFTLRMGMWNWPSNSSVHAEYLPTQTPPS